MLACWEAHHYTVSAKHRGESISCIVDFTMIQTCVVRAWDTNKPLLYCPAMNTLMWEHPITAKHTAALSELGYIQVPPATKLLACGDYGGLCSICAPQLLACFWNWGDVLSACLLLQELELWHLWMTLCKLLLNIWNSSLHVLIEFYFFDVVNYFSGFILLNRKLIGRVQTK